jgi:hypothetical protein
MAKKSSIQDTVTGIQIILYLGKKEGTGKRLRLTNKIMYNFKIYIINSTHF